MLISFSVVSHGHGPHIVTLLESLVSSGLSTACGNAEVLLTLNVPEPQLKAQVQQRDWPFRVVVTENAAPLGFGANHNQAFAKARGDVFAVVNPDIAFLPLDANTGREALVVPPRVGVWVPRQVDRTGKVQDHCRALITPWSLLARVAMRLAGARSLSGVAPTAEVADWVNGALMWFPRQVYQALGGFDERYFMYCEDADLCLRLQLAGWRMQTAPFNVLHDAQRNSLRPGKHLRWHLTSLVKFWCSATFWRYWLKKLSGK